MTSENNDSVDVSSPSSSPPPPDSTSPPSGGRSGPGSLFRNRWVLIGGGVATVVVIVVVVALVFLMRAVDRPGEATAQYIPSDAALYVSVNLRPGADQIMKAKGFADRMEKRDFGDARDELLDELEDETSIDFPDDLMSWVGTDATLVVLEADQDETVWVMMAQVADADEAEDFAERLRSYFEDQIYEEFEEEEDDGLRIWAPEDEQDELEERVAIGLSEEYLFIADTRDTIEDMMDNLGSPPDSPLSESVLFIEAQQSLPEDRFIFAFAQNEGAVAASTEIAMEELFSLYGEDEWYEFVDDNSPDYVAASASFIDHGLRFDVIVDNPFRGLAISQQNGLNTLETLPEDTLLVVSSTGLQELWRETSASLEDADPGTDEELQDLFEDVEEVFDLDFENDLIDSLASEVAVAFLPSDLRQVRGDLAGTLESVLLIGPGAPDDIADALEDSVDFAEDEYSIDFDRDSIGEYDATLMDLDGFDISEWEGYEFGYLIAGEWVAVGSTQDSLESFHGVAFEDEPNLRDSDNFAEFNSLMPDTVHMLAYADLQAILNLVEGALDEYDQEDYQEEWKPWVESLDKVLIVGSVSASDMRVTSAVTVID